MDFPFLEWSVLEQTRFESLTFLYFFQTSPPTTLLWWKVLLNFIFPLEFSLWRPFFACTCTLWCPLQTIHISLKLRSLFWGHLLSVIGQNFFCDYCVKLWHYFDLIHLQCNTDIKCTYLVKWKSGSMTTLTSKVFLSLSCCIYAKMQFDSLFLFRKIYLLYGQNHL